MAKYNKLAGKHVTVIGGSRGIGRGVVEAAIESNARVTLVGSSQKTADAAIAAIKTEYPDAQVVGLGCDLSKPSIEEDVDALLTQAEKLSGEIDHVVYTASDALPLNQLQDYTRDDIIRVSQMRFIAPFMVAKVSQRHLVGAVKGPPGSGKDKSIVLTTGTVATKPAPNWSLVSFFAGGINSMTRGLALDLSPIRVNAVEPGVVITDLWDPIFGEEAESTLQKMTTHLPIGRPGVVEEVVEAYMYLLRDSNATGETVRTGGGIHLV
ncbi:short-chain dehydrogenase [Xylaria nigripes]|nr:short-chain dehydrogenase [Xylaria nigripes]